MIRNQNSVKVIRFRGSWATGNVVKLVCPRCNSIHVWQSCVEIDGYSVMYFDRIAVFEVPYR